MYLLLAALVSTDAHAIDPLPIGNVCALKPPPCLSISLGGNGSIHPGDWYYSLLREFTVLGVPLGGYRLTVLADDPIDLNVGGYWLDESSSFYSPTESTEKVSVYYLPPMANPGFWVDSRNRTVMIDMELAAF